MNYGREECEEKTKKERGERRELPFGGIFNNRRGEITKKQRKEERKEGREEIEVGGRVEKPKTYRHRNRKKKITKGKTREK